MHEHFTTEELTTLYYELDYAYNKSRAGLNLIINYLMSLLLIPEEMHSDTDTDIKNLIDTSDNLREKLIHRCTNTIVLGDDITLNFFDGGKQIRIALFYKKLLFDVPLDELPLYINKSTPVSVVVSWRLKVGK